MSPVQFATIIEKTHNSLVLKPDVIMPGHAIWCINENGILVAPSESQLLMSEELTVMIWKDGFVDTVFAFYNVGDKIGIEYVELNDIEEK